MKKQLLSKQLDDLMSAGLSIEQESRQLLQIHASMLEEISSFDEIVTLNRQFESYVDIPVGREALKQMAKNRRHVARKDSGAYYTPDELVLFLVQTCLIEPLEALSPAEAIKTLQTIKILEPAMGTGAFVIRAFEQMSSLIDKLCSHSAEALALKAHILKNAVYGVDLNPRAVAVVRQTFEYIAKWLGLPMPEQSHFAVGNAIASPLQCHFDIWLKQKSNPIKTQPEDWALSHGWRPFADEYDTNGKFKLFRLDEVFSEVFERENPGFDLILMNPPWNKLVMGRTAWFRAHIDETVHTNKQARKAAIVQLEPQLESEWKKYESRERQILKRIADTTARQVCGLDERKHGHVDACAMFLERAWLLLRSNGILGCVLPNAFYANHGASQERQLMFLYSNPHYLYGFKNSQKLFPGVSAGVRFCLLKTQKNAVSSHQTTSDPLTYPPISIAKTSPEHPVEIGFGFTHIEALSEARRTHQTIVAPVSQCLGLNGEIVPECLTHEAMQQHSRLRQVAETFGDYMDRHHLNLGQEINVTNCAPYIHDIADICRELHLPNTDARLKPLCTLLSDAGYAVFHEKGSFDKFHTGIKDNVRYVFHTKAWLADGKNSQKFNALHQYRVACRSTIHATEAKKSVFALIPPGCVVGNSALVECEPQHRELKYALAMMAVANTSVINEIASQLIGTNLKRFLIRQLPFPKLENTEIERLAILALRLCMPAENYQPLLSEFQLASACSDEERAELMLEIESLVLQKLI